MYLLNLLCELYLLNSFCPTYLLYVLWRYLYRDGQAWKKGQSLLAARRLLYQGVSTKCKGRLEDRLDVLPRYRLLSLIWVAEGHLCVREDL